MANAYLSHQFGKDHTLDINFDYLTFLKPSDQYYANSPLDDNKQLIAAPSVISSSQPVKIHVYSIKADYEKGFTSGLKLDAGMKASAVNTDYNGSFSQLINNNWVNHTGMTNHFVYRKTYMPFILPHQKVLKEMGSTCRPSCGRNTGRRHTVCALQYF